MESKIKKLLDSEESSASIARAVDVSSTTIKRLRYATQKIEGLSLENAKSLYRYQIYKEEKEKLENQKS